AADALELSRRAVARLVAGLGPDDPAVLVALTHLGTACLQTRRDEEAAAAFARAVSVADASGASEPARAAAELSLATALWRTGAKDDARATATVAYARIAATADAPEGAAIFAGWFDQRGLQRPDAKGP
ncbi:MAG: tetratricopeptide repeat protein, partial [Myxococcota bacterium]